MLTPAAEGVAIVIPCFNQEGFLAAAIESAVRQTIAPREIIVVDDGSSTDLSKVTSDYPAVALIRRSNGGLAAARNSGLRVASSDKIVFLDADDLLAPDAVRSGLECFRESPNAAFVYGAHRQVRGTSCSMTYWPVSTHQDLVRCNWVGMIGAVMFDRLALLEHGGFDESLGMCEDWDAYLRLSRHLSFATHAGVVADYVRHGSNASNDLPELWKWIEAVRAKEWERGLDAEGRLAWKDGERVWNAMLGPDPSRRPLIERAARKVARGFLRAIQR